MFEISDLPLFVPTLKIYKQKSDVTLGILDKNKVTLNKIRIESIKIKVDENHSEKLSHNIHKSLDEIMM
jgi:hypothetical protein